MRWWRKAVEKEPDIGIGDLNDKESMDDLELVILWYDHSYDSYNL